MKYGEYWLEAKVGNNVFCWEARQHGMQKIWIAPLLKAGLEELALGDQPVFFEQDSSGRLKSFVGLRSFLHRHYQGVPVYVFDNHNHALSFWYQEWRKGTFKQGISLLHIDQHSDMADNSFFLKGDSPEALEFFVNQCCHVGNFILPALRSGLCTGLVQIRTEYTLLAIPLPQEEYILDIDLDFWAPEMGIEQFAASLAKTQALIAGAKMVTIATSPYFLDQERAFDLLHQLFPS